MGVNWAAGLMRWWPHADPVSGVAYPLHHLHPFRFALQLPESARYPALEVDMRVGFSMHTFTRKEIGTGDSAWRYSDDRETRIFDLDRYALSKHLPEVVRTIERRKCYHAKDQNFLTLGQPDGLPAGHEYQVFFDLRRWRAKEAPGGPPVIQLIVQSAYATLYGQAPRGLRRQPVGFHVLIYGAVTGNRPQPRRY